MDGFDSECLEPAQVFRFSLEMEDLDPSRMVIELPQFESPENLGPRMEQLCNLGPRMNQSEPTEETSDTVAEFTLAEIIKMQILFKEVGERSLSQEFCQELATRFSSSIHRTGKPPVTWEQVQTWFQEQQNRLAAKVTKRSHRFRRLNRPSHMLDDAINCQLKPKGERIASLSELAFEAKSAKDTAWFDVAAFLNYRVLYSGELEVRVRFAGFNNKEDEWVNVRWGVRERSIPLEPSECDRVKVGDLVLCYRENEDLALYCDAHIVEIKRSSHDITDCACVFLVRYDYDMFEEEVDLKRLCCRPT